MNLLSGGCRAVPDHVDAFTSLSWLGGHDNLCPDSCVPRPITFINLLANGVVLSDRGLERWAAALGTGDLFTAQTLTRLTTSVSVTSVKQE